jgi:catechol 2,3-dioxygenase-like lactoylglutathione lyase family enzyme
MQLTKSVIDVGLSTNDLEPMLRFWQQDVGLRFDHVLPVRRGQKQHRHDAQGSVIKLNHHAEPLPEAAPSGYRELIIAREDLQKPRRMVDPDGNRVQLVPKGYDGVTQIAVAMRVRSLSEHRRSMATSSAFPSSPGPPARPFAWATALFFSKRTVRRPPIRFVRHAAGATSPCRSPISTRA